jgi:2-polyprenyl-3-methyl-5-hydroxy-6-metoxy-1,4-benzoquinol methylase
LTNVRSRRREFIEAAVALGGGTSILEIGAMDAPTYPERDARYLDWFSGDELRERHSANPRRANERIVDVDYVVKEKRFAAAVAERFDVVIANHVIEHVADPIGWLGEIAQITRDGGSLFLAVPDRRYTFDYLRPVSTAADVVRASEEGLERPSRWQMLEAIFYHRPIQAADAWEGRLEEKLATARFTLEEALAHAARAEREYVDVHCHVFTADSFGPLVRDLADGGLIGWRLAGLAGVAEGGNEFLAWLVRGDAEPERHPETAVDLESAGSPRPYRPNRAFLGDYVDEFHQQIELSVPGSLRREDALKLYEAGFFGQGDILELGTNRGLSAWVLARSIVASGREARVVTIDLSKACCEEAKRNIATEGLEEFVEIHHGDADAICRGFAAEGRRFGMAFVDHSHAYEHVAGACARLDEVLEPGSMAVFHDFNDARNSDRRDVGESNEEFGVIQAVRDSLDPGRFEFVGVYGSCGVFRKIA